jgi:hypothetical protein
MNEGIKQIPTPDRLAAEVKAIEDRRITLGKLRQLVPGGTLWQTISHLLPEQGDDSDPTGLLGIASAIKRSIVNRGIDESEIEKKQASLHHPDQEKSNQAAAELDNSMANTLYYDLRVLGVERDHLIDFMPGKSIDDLAS